MATYTEGASTMNREQHLDTAYKTIQAVKGEMHRAVEIYPNELDELLGALAMDGSVIFDEDPGVGKTMTALALARAIGGSFGRIQGAPDNMPSDIVGKEIWSWAENDFEFRQGPVFANVLLADEANRNQPKTQAGLLEAMQERKVTVGNKVYYLPRPFIVLATQNHNEEIQGTYPLTKANIDRFAVGASLTWDEQKESAVLARDLGNGYEVEAIRDPEAILQLQNARSMVEVSGHIRSSILKLTKMVMQSVEIDPETTQLSGARKNAQIAMFGQYMALSKKREVVELDDIADAATPILSHRIGVEDRYIDQGVTSRTIVAKALERIS